jgi:hypothetical protein
MNKEPKVVDLSTLEYRSRTVVEKLALGLQASVLLKDGDEHVARGLWLRVLIDRHYPECPINFYY